MGRLSLNRAGAALLLAALAGCAAVEPLPDLHRQPLPLPAEIAERFSYTRMPIADSLEQQREEDGYVVYDVRIEAGLDDGDDGTPITLEYYERRRPRSYWCCLS
jgi:hypothetical protein